MLDLRDGERLSSVALIKRVFPQVYNELEKTNLPINFPSTTYMSAISWIKHVAKNEREWALEFLKEAKKLKGACSETRAGIQDLGKLMEDDKEVRDFISLNGNYFYPPTLLNDQLWDDNTQTTRERLAEKLKTINSRVFQPDTYYALLSMDGDRIGALLQQHKDKKVEISNAISAFSKSVPGIIKKRNGRVIYAGGEDVFAILPVDYVIAAAVELREKYMELFETIFGSIEIATISAAIIFAHHHAPLSQIYSEIQFLLDKVAKNQYGRGALAISTWTTGGPNLCWAMPWQKLITKQSPGSLLEELAEEFGDRKKKREAAEGISHSFIYKLRKELSLFTDEDLVFSDRFLALLTAEYMRSKGKGGNDLSKEQVLPLMKKLLAVCKIYYRNEKGYIEQRRRLNIDGALIVKFLARRWQHEG